MEGTGEFVVRVRLLRKGQRRSSRCGRRCLLCDRGGGVVVPHHTKAAPSWLTWPASRSEPPQLCCRLHHLRGWSDGEAKEVSRRGSVTGVRMVAEAEGDYPSRWAAIDSVATMIGCNAQTSLLWVRQAERDASERPGLTTDEKEKLRELESENRGEDRGDDRPRPRQCRATSGSIGP